jgi:hypothetical protein
VITNALLARIGGEHIAEIAERLEVYREMMKMRYGGRERSFRHT